MEMILGLLMPAIWQLLIAIKNGMLNSTSMMTNMDGCIEAAKLWKDNPGLSVGIHLCLTAGKTTY